MAPSEPREGRPGLPSAEGGPRLPPGSLGCPRCGATIQVVLQEMLERRGLTCDACGLELHLGKSDAIPDLERLASAERRNR